MRVHIKNGRLFDPAAGLNAIQDLFIAEGRIIGHGPPPDGFSADHEIEAKDRIVIPGLVDLAARLCEPGHEYKASFDSECRSANSGGVTSICCPPDSRPVIDSTAVVDFIKQRAAETGRARIYPIAALTQGLEGRQLSEMQTLRQAGCIGVGNARAPMDNAEVLRRAFEYARSCDLTVFLFAEDRALKNNGVAHEGALSTRLGLPAIPETAETVAVSRALLLAEQTRARVHFCRLSSARATGLIRAARAEGLAVTADVAVSHLHLTEMDISGYNSNCHLQPPLRAERDRQGLLEGMNDQTIGAVCSDHQPHDADAKAAPFGQTEPGASTLEHLLPLLLRLVEREALTLETAITTLTAGPAAILGVNKGALTIGADADICIFDPEARALIAPETLISAGKNSPFIGWELPGLVTHTLLAGRPVYRRA